MRISPVGWYLPRKSWPCKGEPCSRLYFAGRPRGRSRSGRRSDVSRSASLRRHSSIFLWSPESRTSGIDRPAHSRGLVYCGCSSRPFSKLSLARLSAAPTTPGNRRTQASINTIRGKLTARQHVIPDRNFFEALCGNDPLVDAFETSRKQRHTRTLGKVAR